MRTVVLIGQLLDDATILLLHSILHLYHYVDQSKLICQMAAGGTKVVCKQNRRFV